MYIATYKNLSDEALVSNRIRQFCEMNHLQNNIKVVPVPRQISVTCGIANEFEFEDLAIWSSVIFSVVSEKTISPQNLHLYTTTDSITYTLLDWDILNCNMVYFAAPKE